MSGERAISVIAATTPPRIPASRRISRVPSSGRWSGPTCASPVYDLPTGHLARMIERRMAELGPGAGTASLPPAATARVFAGALMELMEMMHWWVNRGATTDAREMDAQFHEIVWGGLARMARPPVDPA